MMKFEIMPPKPTAGLSSKEKKKLKQEARKEELNKAKDRARRGENYGDIKVSRRIPEEISQTVQERDSGRDFGRPNHECDKPGPPHHITHFEKYLYGEEEGNPHTEENLEAPCKDCHNLAHEMGIPSGTSIEEFFRDKFNNPK